MNTQPLRWPSDFPGKHDRYPSDSKARARVILKGKQRKTPWFTQSIGALFAKLDKIEDKLDRKVDK